MVALWVHNPKSLGLMQRVQNDVGNVLYRLYMGHSVARSRVAG